MYPEAFLYDLKCTPTGSAALPSEGICSSDTPYPQPKSKFPAQIASGMKPQEGRLQSHKSREYINQCNIKAHFLRIMRSINV